MAEDGRKHRILVVEDEDNIAIALDFLMTREGYAHDRVANGAEAMPRIRATHPDLVLLDVMLPEVSGYEICQSVRLDPALADVKILMMTARGVATGGPSPSARRGLSDVAQAEPASAHLPDLRGPWPWCAGGAGGGAGAWLSAAGQPRNPVGLRAGGGDCRAGDPWAGHLGLVSVRRERGQAHRHSGRCAAGPCPCGCDGRDGYRHCPLSGRSGTRCHGRRRLAGRDAECAGRGRRARDDATGGRKIAAGGVVV
ncbi:UNVERIFIED_CONTAM: ycf27 [Trichonephila clavipes]